MARRGFMPAVAAPDGGRALAPGVQRMRHLSYGGAAGLGSPPPGSARGIDPAAPVFTRSDGGGYWVVTAAGQVFNVVGAPADAHVSDTRLSGAMIAASAS